MKLPQIQDLDLASKRVLVRCDLNVPLKDGEVTDEMRIEASIPTLQLLLEMDATVICCSHLGRPKGKTEPSLSLAPVARVMERLLGSAVLHTSAPNGPIDEVDALTPGEVALLENLRFDPREEANDPGFAKELASMADAFVCDAFGAVHRAHASVAGVPQLLPSAAGLLLTREVEVLTQLTGNPPSPFVVVLGGAKVSDKIGVVRNLLSKADAVLIGGAMANTFLAATGRDVGSSKVESERIKEAQETLSQAEEAGCRIVLPGDLVVAKAFEESAEGSVVLEGDPVPSDAMALDIGPGSAEKFAAEIRGAQTVLWNGPMGVFEWKAFEGGTKLVAHAIADSPATTVVGGGDSAAALDKFGLTEKVTHLSTGGGASLELLEGRELPGLAALVNAR